MDWTYDLYIEDVKKYGIDDNGESYTSYFISDVKRTAEKFVSKWKSEHDNKLYDHGWVGDAFAENLLDWFSDFYKEAYNQRPHLPIWYYVHPLGLPMSEDTIRTFCANPIEEAVEEAKRMRNNFDGVTLGL